MVITGRVYVPSAVEEDGTVVGMGCFSTQETALNVLRSFLKKSHQVPLQRASVAAWDVDVVGDDAMDLYVYKPGMPKAKPPVHDGSCFCNRFMDMTTCAFIRCNGCRRECHVQCAFPEARNMSDDEIDRWVDDNEKSYQCPKCQPQKGKKRRAAGM